MQPIKKPQLQEPGLNSTIESRRLDQLTNQVYLKVTHSRWVDYLSTHLNSQALNLLAKYFGIRKTRFLTWGISNTTRALKIRTNSLVEPKRLYEILRLHIGRLVIGIQFLGANLLNQKPRLHITYT